MIELLVGSAVMIFLYMSLWFVIALILKDNGIVDIAWGLGFTIVAWYLYIAMPGSLLITLMVTAWGVRLAIHIAVRNRLKKGEDFRYKNWREEWGDRWVINSFLRVFMLQGLVMFFVSLPILIGNIAHVGYHLNIAVVVGFLVYLVGMYFEVLGDYQLFVFKKNPNNKGRIMKTGLWAYTRHPNYFGEAVLWWGIFITTLSFWPLSWIGVISPILLTWLLLKVSGVPMLEEKYASNPEFMEYASKTSSFFPRKPKG